MTETPDRPSRHARRGVSVLHLLARLWRQRDARRWIVHGKDERGRSVSVRVAFDEGGVALSQSRSGEVFLAPLQAGRLRAALRDAIESIDQPVAAAHEITKLPADPSAPNVPPVGPTPRVRVVLGDPQPATRPKFRPFGCAGMVGAASHREDMTAPIWPEHDHDTCQPPGRQDRTCPHNALPAGSPPRGHEERAGELAAPTSRGDSGRDQPESLAARSAA